MSTSQITSSITTSAARLPDTTLLQSSRTKSHQYYYLPNYCFCCRNINVEFLLTYLWVFYYAVFPQHPAISEFPSQEFYNGQLETRLSPLWTGSPLPFWPLLRNEPVPHLFVDVRGQEEMLTVTTDEGNEKSKSNKQEARKVVIC